jgi:hypothetical protein
MFFFAQIHGAELFASSAEGEAFMHLTFFVVERETV